MNERKQKLRELFNDYDYHLGHLIALGARIKEEAVPYWKEQGYTVLPRLERLREDVLKPDTLVSAFCPDCDDPLSEGGKFHGKDCPRA